MLIRSTAAGAPTLTGETGKLYDVLKWALPTLGWSIAFDDEANHRIAFRNDPVTGTGDYLRIADNSADHDGSNAKTANVRSYSTMSDVDTGTDEVGEANWLICKSMTADATARPWALVGDATYFWLLIASGNDDFFQEYYYGDFASDKPADSGRFVTQANTTLDPIFNNFATPFLDYANTINGRSQSRFNIAATLVGRNLFYSNQLRNSDAVPRGAPPGSLGTYPEPGSGGLRVSDILCQEQGAIRGRMKGAVQILNNVIGQFANFETIAGQMTQRGAKDMIAVNRYARPNNITDQGVLMFDTDHGAW